MGSVVVFGESKMLHLFCPYSKQVSQMQAPLAACGEPVGIQNRPQKNALYVFKHKT